jgi:hypothetical protein
MKTDYCEHPNHKQYFKDLLAKYPTASKHDGYGAIITANPEDWGADLEHPEKNTVKCCQMCSISEGIKRTTFENISTSKHAPILITHPG